MKPNFLKAALSTRIPEGFYSAKSRSDPETIYGVNRKAHPRARVWGLVDPYKKKPGFPNNMRTDTKIVKAAMEAYRPYWKAFKLDQLPSHKIAQEIFDGAFNMGIARQTFYIQKTCNALNEEWRTGKPLFKKDLKVDAFKKGGGFGKKTLTALKIVSHRYPRACFNQLNFFQGAWYGEMGNKNPLKRKYVRGLHKRVSVIRRGE